MSSEKIQAYIDKQVKWKSGLEKLRSVLLSTELEETVKWGMPTYTINGKNVVGFSGFKNHFGLWFFQGSFLKDPHNLLINAQEGKTKALRQMRFQDTKEIKTTTIKNYVKEAIANSKAGKQIKPEKKTLAIPAELKKALNEDKFLKSAFEKFTPGKQKEFSEYITEAKREATKISRLEKIIPMIKDGVGLNDKYKK